MFAGLIFHFIADKMWSILLECIERWFASRTKWAWIMVPSRAGSLGYLTSPGSGDFIIVGKCFLFICRVSASRGEGEGWSACPSNQEPLSIVTAVLWVAEGKSMGFGARMAGSKVWLHSLAAPWIEVGYLTSDSVLSCFIDEIQKLDGGSLNSSCWLGL